MLGFLEKVMNALLPAEKVQDALDQAWMTSVTDVVDAVVLSEFLLLLLVFFYYILFFLFLFSGK